MATQAGNPARAKGNAPSYSVWRDAAGGVTRGVNNHTGLTPYSAATADVVVAAILTELGSNAGSVAFSADTHSVAASTTVPANIGLQAVQGTLLRPASGQTLTLNGTLDAGPYQIFDLSAGGSVVLPKTAVVCPEWWGAVADGGITDNRAAFDQMVASGAYAFRPRPGDYGFKTADASGNALTLPTVGMDLGGFGYGLTRLLVLCPTTWGVKSAAAEIKQHDFSVVVGTGGSAVYGVGVSTASAGSAESCMFQNIEVLASGTGTVANGFAVGPDNPGSSSMDIAETSFLRCRATGTFTGAGFLIGNGTVGNILCTWLTHCTALHGQYGVKAQATGFVWRDGTATGNALFDFTASPQGTDPVVIDGVRSELSAGLWQMTGSTSAANVSIRGVDYFASAIAANGQWIDHSTGGVFELRNAVCRSAGSVTPVVHLHPSAPLVANLSGVASEATFSVAFDIGGTAGGSVNVWGYQQLNGDDTIASTKPPTILGLSGSGGQLSVKVTGSGISIQEGGAGGKQGTATLTAGTVTVANTSVTATSRIQLTAQDNNTTGALRVSARTAGTSFTITSSNSGDTGVVAYEIFEPA